MKVITVYNKKGGVSKTSTAISMASYLNKYENKNVLFIDLDPQCDATHQFKKIGTSPCAFELVSKTANLFDCMIALKTEMTEDKKITRINLALIPAVKELEYVPVQLCTKISSYMNLKEAITNDPNVEKMFDYIIIDCNTNFNLLVAMALIASDYLLIPAEGDISSVDALKSLKDEFDENNIQILNKDLKIAGVLLTKKQTVGRNETVNYREIKEDLKRKARELFDSPVFNTEIRTSINMPNARSKGLSIFEYDPECSVAKDYFAFMEEFLHTIGEK